jgi:hypothetical protein
MRRLPGFLVPALALLVGCAGSQNGPPVPNDTSFSALKQEYDETIRKFQEDQQKQARGRQEQAAAFRQAAEKELQEAKTEQEKAAAQQKMMQAQMMGGMNMANPMAGLCSEFAPRFLAFAEKNPNDPSVFECLVLAVHTSGGAGGPDGTYDKALDQLRANHVTNPEIGRVLKELNGPGDEATEKLLREVLAKNPDHKAQGLACKALVGVLENVARVADVYKGDPEQRRNAEIRQGKDGVEKLIAEGERKKKEAVELAKTLDEKYGDVVPKPAVAQAGPEVGTPAPEIEGEDADSKKFKLSDYRGKVVLLDFWGNW